MGKIVKKTVVMEIYISSDGNETLLSEMNDSHLVNAFGQAAAGVFDGEVTRGLRTEILRRLSICKLQNEK